MIEAPSSQYAHIFTSMGNLADYLGIISGNGAVTLDGAEVEIFDGKTWEDSKIAERAKIQINVNTRNLISGVRNFSIS